MSADAQAAWNVGQAKHPATQQDGCLLTSESISVDDGYGQTKVTLFVNNDTVTVVTDSEIDGSYNDLGLQVDDKAPLTTNQVLRKKIVVFDQQIPEVIKQFRAGKEASVFLRFWPTWPSKGRIPVKFSLRGFTRAHDGLATCTQPAAR